MRPSRRAVVAAVCTLITALGLGACGETLANGPSASDQGFVSGDGTLTVVPVAERGEAPSLEGARLGGGRLDLAEFRGDVVVLNVWGSWCGPCRKEAPELQQVAEELKPEGVQFIGLNTRDKAEPAQAFVDRFGVTYPTVLDPDGTLQLAFSDTLPPAAIPSTLIIDREGRVAGRIIGPLTSAAVLRDLAQEVADNPMATAKPSSEPTSA